MLEGAIADKVTRFEGVSAGNAVRFGAKGEREDQG